MSTQSVTLQLPEPVFRYLLQLAASTKRPLEQLVRQSVEGNLPPPVTNAPPEMQAELLELQLLSVEELLRVANSQIDPEQGERHLSLLEKNGEAGLTPEEAAELDVLRLAADRLLLRKAYAWAVLRWRGYPTPALEQLPLA